MLAQRRSRFMLISSQPAPAQQDLLGEGRKQDFQEPLRSTAAENDRIELETAGRFVTDSPS
jgi:hypothetical protein